MHMVTALHTVDTGILLHKINISCIDQCSTSEINGITNGVVGFQH